MRRLSAALTGILIAAVAAPAAAWPVSPAHPGIGNGITLVQRSMPRQLVPLTPQQVAAIGKAIAAIPEHPFPTEDAATAAGRDLLKNDDFLGAHDAFVALAMKGNAAAIYMLGVMYTGGRGVKQDFPAAAKLFVICGEANHPFCQNALVDIYKTGKGVPSDPVQAQRWADLLARSPYMKPAPPRP